MSVISKLIVALCCALWLCGPMAADVFLPVDRDFATVCPASDLDQRPPDPSSSECETITAFQVDPQDKHIWAFYNLNIDSLPVGEPLGLTISAKASSHVFLNGAPIGENGIPASQRRDETVGRMDVIFPIFVDQLHMGDNTVAVRMSSHRGYLKLMAPVHNIAVSTYAIPQDRMFRSYGLSLLPFGAFMLAAIYFLTMVGLGGQKITSGLLGGLSLVAAIQLLFEVDRGLTAYAYPFQDIRLIAITTCSAVFGLGLAVYIIFRFRPQSAWPLVPGTIGAVLLALFMTPGFDGKASFALLVPTMIAAGVALSAVRTEPRAAITITAGLLAFALINFFGAGRFLDQYFYFAVAALMLVLFALQASTLAHEQALRRMEQGRAEKLQFVLDELNAPEAEFAISVKSGTQTRRIAAEAIAYIKGAGDYAELVLQTGETHLHSTTLADLESELPAYFLRVHRSYFVNTRLIDRLQRHPSGTGELSLTSDQTVPVSRRIMPKVKAAMA